MKSFTTLLATGTLFTATVFAQNTETRHSDNSAATTTTALDAEPAIPTVTEGSGPANSASTASGAIGAPTNPGLPHYEPLPTTTGRTHTIDGTLYVPATMCMDYTSYTDTACPTSASTNGGPHNPTDAHPTTMNTAGITTNLPTASYTDHDTTLQTSTVATSTSTTSASLPTGAQTSDVPIAHVKLSSSSGEGGRQYDIPTDNTVTPILSGKGLRADEMSVISVSGDDGDGENGSANVKCTAFSDEEGKVHLGSGVEVGKTGDLGMSGAGGVEGGMKVRSVRCAEITQG